MCERGNVLEEGLNIFFGVFADAHACGGGVLDDAVVHVGNVHDLQHAIALGMQEAPQDVLKNEGAEIADVREGVDRRAAGVDAHLARMERVRAARDGCSWCCAS